MAKNFTNKLTNRLAQLPPEVTIISFTSHLHATELRIAFPESNRICPDCGSSHCVIKSSAREQTVRHVALNGQATFLTFSKHRFVCRDCGRSFYEQPDWLHPHLRMTNALYTSICLDLTELISITAIARKNCITDSVVTDILRKLPMPRPSRLPETLCIDEFSGDAGTWDASRNRWHKDKFQCNISDAHTGSVIEVLPYTQCAAISDYFFRYPLHERERVRFFCCDMHGGYIKVAKDCFPNAVICLDKFHVIKRLNTAVDDIRVHLQKEAKDSNPELGSPLLLGETVTSFGVTPTFHGTLCLS